jgi:ribosomal protein L17
MQQTPEEESKDIVTSPENVTADGNLRTAENPNVEPELLRQLAVSEDRAIREAVAANPNTPTEVLLKLAEAFPQQFLKNPVLSLLLLENPNFAAEIPYYALLNLLKQPELPDFFLSSAANHSNPEILYLVAKHPNTPDNALEEMARRNPKDTPLGLSIIKRQYVSEQVLSTIVEHSAIAVRLCLAKNPATSGNILAKLAIVREANPNFQQEIHLKLAKNPNTPIQVIYGLLKKRDTYGKRKIKQAISQRSDLPISIIIDLACDFQIHATNSLAKNLSIGADVLVELANHPELQVRQMVVRHPNVPQTVLDRAVTTAELRQYVAENISTPADLLVELVKSGEEEILKAIATNPSATASVLESITKTRSQDILIAQHPNATTKLLQQILWRLAMDERLSVRKYVAKHPHTPIDILIAWVQKQPELRLFIAQNPSISPEIIEQLAEDASAKVREALAYNSITPSYILEKLAKVSQIAVRQAVASNPKTSGSVLEFLAQDWQCSTFVAQNPNTPTKVLEYLMQLSGFNWLLLAHPNTSLEMQHKLLCMLGVSGIDSERIYAAKHPHTPVEVLMQLTRDRNPEIQSAALRTIAKHDKSPTCDRAF